LELAGFYPSDRLANREKKSRASTLNRSEVPSLAIACWTSLLVGPMADYNHRRYHESIHNLTPADVYCGRGQIILLQRERIKRQTIALRRLQHQRRAA
jgi:hypothetical protein